MHVFFREFYFLMVLAAFLFVFQLSLLTYKDMGSVKQEADKRGQGEGGDWKLASMCGLPLWMTPYDVASLQILLFPKEM